MVRSASNGMAESAPFSDNGTYMGHFMANTKLYCYILCRGKKLMGVIVFFPEDFHKPHT